MFVSADGQPQQLLQQQDLPLQQSSANTASFADFDTASFTDSDTASFADFDTASFADFDTAGFTDFDTAGFTDFDTASFTDFQSLLPAEDDSSLFVAPGFQASIVFLQLFWRLSNHFQDFGGFGEFFVRQ